MQQSRTILHLYSKSLLPVEYHKSSLWSCLADQEMSGLWARHHVAGIWFFENSMAWRGALAGGNGAELRASRLARCSDRAAGGGGGRDLAVAQRRRKSRQHPGHGPKRARRGFRPHQFAKRDRHFAATSRRCRVDRRQRQSLLTGFVLSRFPRLAEAGHAAGRRGLSG